MNQRMLSAMTLTLLVVLVASPLLFIALQAIFPQFSAGNFSGAFSGVQALLAEPQLPRMLGGTLQVGLGVALVSALIGFPLGVARGGSTCRGRVCGICFS